MKKLFVFIPLFLLGYNLVAQDAVSIVEKAEMLYVKDNLTLEMEYFLYPTYTATNSYLNYEAIFIKELKNTFFKMQNTEMIGISNHFIKIAHDQKLIQYKEASIEELGQSNPMSIKKLMPYYTKKELKLVDGIYKCTFYTSKITQLPYSRIELFIDADTFTLKKQIMYFNQTKKYQTKTGEVKNDYPRLEINCQLKESNELDRQTFVLSSYIATQNNKIVLNKKYTKYQLVD